MTPVTIDKSERKPLPAGALFSIIIPTWNNLPYLQLCLRSIRQHSVHQHQVIVHINEGSDRTLEWLQQQNDVDYTYSKQNIGVCYALNSCRTLVATEYVLYMNDDMYVCPGWDDVLYQEIKAIGHPYFFLSATAIEAVPQSKCSIEKNYGRNIETFEEDKLLSGFALLPMSDWSGASWPPNVVHRNTWDLIGGYSIEFSPGMYSDPDFSMKLWHAGVRIFKGLSASRVYHFGSLSTKRIKHNSGYYTFVSKWATTQNVFSKLYLRKGEKYTGEAREPRLSFFIKLKNVFKQLKSAFYR